MRLHGWFPSLTARTYLDSEKPAEKIDLKELAKQGIVVHLLKGVIARLQPYIPVAIRTDLDDDKTRPKGAAICYFRGASSSRLDLTLPYLTLP